MTIEESSLSPGIRVRSTAVDHANPSKVRDVVDSYMKNRLPRDLHPSFQTIDGKAADSTPALPTAAQTEPSAGIADLRGDGDTSADAEDEDDVSLDDIYENAEEEKTRFASAMEDYEKVADAKYKTNISTGALHTWEEVLEELNQAASQHKEGSFLWKKIRRGLQKFGDSNKVFDAWLGLLPTQSNYCSLICGGLKLILKAAARLKELRESTCEALAEIPVLLNNTKLILGVFRKSSELHMCSSALYVSTLGALEHMVTWYGRNAARKGFMAFIKQDAYERDLTEKLQTVKTNSERFAEAAKVCSYQKQEIIHRGIKANRNETRQNRSLIERSRRESVQNYSSLNQTLRTESTDIQQGVSGIASEMAKLATNQADLQVFFVENLPGILKDFLSGNERLDQTTHDIREPHLPRKSTAKRLAIFEKQRLRMQEEILDLLYYEESVPLEDIKAILRIAWGLPRTAQDRAVSLMQSPKLHAWIKATSSSALFANGNYDPSVRQSPLSFVCAKLVDSIYPATEGAQQKANGIIAHAFFCGQHLSSKDPASGVAGMMRSLLAQLLVAYSGFELAVVSPLRHIGSDDVESMCEIFATLILQIPENTMVFCIIDAMTFHEDSSARSKEAQKVVQMLLDVVVACGEGSCIFKVLLTSPGNSRALYRGFSKEDVIWMPKKVTAQGGFTSMKWSASAGRDVGGLVAG